MSQRQKEGMASLIFMAVVAAAVWLWPAREPSPAVEEPPSSVSNAVEYVASLEGVQWTIVRERDLYVGFAMTNGAPTSDDWQTVCHAAAIHGSLSRQGGRFRVWAVSGEVPRDRFNPDAPGFRYLNCAHAEGGHVVRWDFPVVW